MTSEGEAGHGQLADGFQHRGLGTHISKPRSVDLDNWAPEMVRLAQDWGNARGNAFWECNKPIDWVPSDE